MNAGAMLGKTTNQKGGESILSEVWVYQSRQEEAYRAESGF